MSLQDFIFSEKRSDRIKQHLLFWGLWFPYITFTNAANPFGSEEASYFPYPIYSLFESFFVVFAHLPLTYVMLYFVLPRFILKQKYVVVLAIIPVLWFTQGAINLIFLGKLLPGLLNFFLPPHLLPPPRNAGDSFFMAVIATNKGAFTIVASALMLKFAKHWYHKEHRNLQLQKENAQSQLRLLTAQIHPHFLFNTLNNIYSQVQHESRKGADMVMALSDLLRYILYEGQKPLVPLKDELHMIREYIQLERIRYGNKLEVHVLTPDDADHHMIAPLLLLPLVENCFKHGTSHILQNPWINLTVELKKDTLVMKLMNGKMPTQEQKNGPSGLGVNNVRQRLELLYKNNHELQIREDEEVFVVDLKVDLIRREDTSQRQEEAAGQSKNTYA